MNTTIKFCKIVNAEGASQFGFNIEDDIAFIFDLGQPFVGCLGRSSDGPNSHWQFDAVDENLNAYQFIEKDLIKAIVRAELIAAQMHNVSSIKSAFIRLGLERV